VDSHSFAPIGLNKTDAASDCLLKKRHCVGTKGLLGVQLQNLLENIRCRRDFINNQKEDDKIRGASGKFKNQPRPLLRPTVVL
jgi:hypothetical protein